MYVKAVCIFLSRSCPGLTYISKKRLDSIHHPGWFYFWFKWSLKPVWKAGRLRNKYLCATRQAQRDHFRLRRPEPTITCHCGTEKCFLGSTFFGKKKSQQFISNFNLPHYIFIDISEQLKTTLQIGIAHANFSLQILLPQIGSLRSTINFSGDLLLPNYESS